MLWSEMRENSEIMRLVFSCDSKPHQEVALGKKSAKCLGSGL